MALSPDVFGTIKSSNHMFHEDEEQTISMEMKIRQKPAPIQHAYVTRKKYGAEMHCNYGDDFF